MESGEESTRPSDEEWWIDYSRWPGPRYEAERVKDFLHEWTLVVGHHRYKPGEILVINGEPLGLVKSYSQSGGNLINIAGEPTVPTTSIEYEKLHFYY